MKNKILLGLFVLLLFSSSLVVAFAQTNSTDNGGVNHVYPEVTQSINPDGVPLTIPAYNRTEATLTYSEAYSYYVNVSSYSTAHYESQSPTMMTVAIESTGTFILRFHVYYLGILNQTVTLTINGADGRPITIPIQCENSGFTLDVIITTSMQPEYPTAEELWEFGHQQQVDLIGGMALNFQNMQTWWVAGLIAVIVVVIIICVVVAILWREQKRRIFEDARVIHRGFG